VRCTVEICVIFAEPTFYLEEQVRALKEQKDKEFCVLYVPDKELSPEWKKRLELDSRFRVLPSGKATIPVKRNFCIRHLRTNSQWVAFLDDDSFPPPDWMGHLKERIRLDPDQKVLSGPSLPPPSAPVLERAVGLAVQSFVGFGSRAKWSRKLPKPFIIRETRTCNLIIHCSCYEAPNSLFDETLSIGEDMEWCRRIRNNQGVSIWMYPELYVYNHNRPLFYPAFLQYFRYGSYRMKLLLSGKDRGFFETLSVLPPMGVVMLPLAAIVYPRAVALLLFLYFSLITVEGVADKKGASDQILRLFTIPYVHLCYGLGLFARLFHLRRRDVGVYVRAETKKAKWLNLSH
jgi:hypothetical protein